MFNDRISDYFEGVAAKHLSAVDADRSRSNQHEIGGLSAAGFKQWLGAPGKHEEFRFKALQIYIRDEDDAPLTCEGEVTWYDSRRNVEHRGPEYRLYYFDSPVTLEICEGDFLLIAKMRDGSLLMVFTPGGSTTENQLRTLFGLDQVADKFVAGSVEAIELLLPLRLMLEDLGIELSQAQHSDDAWLEKIISAFGDQGFPGTSAFSKFARESVASELDPLEYPDDALMSWMTHEEKLFRIYERHLVQGKLKEGFGSDVDDFINFSLSVQNRRKSRVGHAFEGHLDHLFKHHGLLFEQGRGKDRYTENNAKPDFLFPSFSAYRREDFPEENLLMLGAKTTCKDRWRQVLSEAARIRSKHLVTLEASISEAQTNEMASHNLHLVIPSSIQATYSEKQQRQLLSLSQFIEMAKSKQA